MITERHQTRLLVVCALAFMLSLPVALLSAGPLLPFQQDCQNYMPTELAPYGSEGWNAVDGGLDRVPWPTLRCRFEAAGQATITTKRLSPVALLPLVVLLVGGAVAAREPGPRR